MAPEQSVPSETQDQSIKSRKHQLFDAEAEIPVEQTRARSVEDYLRMTPAQPFEMGLKLGLGAAGAVVVMLLGFVLFTGHKSKVRAVDLGPPVGGALLAKNSPSAATPTSNNSSKPDGSASSGDKDGKGDGDKPKEKSKNKGKGKGKNKKKKAEDEEEKDEPPKPIDPAQWRVAVDAPEQTLEVPAGQELSLAVPAGPEREGDALFSSTPSPFVALGNNDVEGDAREVWDLRSKKRVGVIRGDLKAKPPFVISPDGVFLAAKLDKDKKDDKDKDKGKEHTIAIWSFKTGGEVKQIKTSASEPDFIEFATIGLLVTGNLREKKFEVWNIPKAESLGTFKAGGPIDKGSLALSPGRKFLAMSSLIDGRLRFFDLTTQEPCGEAALPKDLAGATCASLSFASDGKELAGAYDAGGKLRLICWEAASGKVVADHVFDPKPGTFDRAADVGGETLEWLPDRSGWLLAGQAIVDRQTGKRIWSLPLDPYDFPPGPRKMVDSDRALIVWGQGRSKVVRTVALPKDKLANARKFVQSNKSAVDAVLPAAKPADWSGQHTVPAAAASWSVKPEDDKVANPAKGLLSRPIALKSRLDEVRRVFCSGGEASQAVVSSMVVDRDNFAGNVLNAGHEQSLDHLDLLNGKRLGSDKVPACSDAIALSPDGTRVLLRDAEDGERLDLFGYTGTELKHLAGWRPYEKETGEGRQVIWAAFLDTTHALTVNATGTLVMWVVPDCRAYYSVKKACQGAPALSQGRKVLAGLAEDSIRFFDPATGQEIGKTPAPSVEGGGKPGTFAGAFRRDCQQMTMVLGGSLLARVDLKTGKVISEFRSPVVPAYELTWCGNRHVLINNWSLIDLDKQLEVWRYEAGVPAHRSPDGRFWSAVEPFPGQPAALSGFVIPDKSVDKLVAVVQDKNTKALLRSHTPVSLQIDINSDSKEADALRLELFERFSNQLKANEIPLQPRQAVTLVVRVAEVDSGEVQPAGAFAPALEKSEDGKKPVSIRNLELEVLLVDAAGKASLEPKQTILQRNLGQVKMSPTDKDVDRYLRNRLYNEVRARLSRVVIPPFAARAADGLAKFPGFTHLGQATR